MVTKPKYVMTQRHLKNISEANKKNRKKYSYVEMALQGSEVKYVHEDAEKVLEKEYARKIYAFFTNLGTLILWREYKKQSQISIEAQIQDLSQKLGQDLSGKFADLVLFLTEYRDNLLAANKLRPYPETVQFHTACYEFRKEAMESLKKEGIKTLKNILEDKK